MAKSHIKTLGSSNHTEEARESNDYYATYPADFNIFLDKIKEDGIIFKLSSEFIFKSMDLLGDGGYLMLLLPLRYLETKARYRLFKRYMPRYVYAYSYRINIGKSGVFEGGNAVAYAWFVWEKGSKKETVVRFIPSPKWKEV